MRPGLPHPHELTGAALRHTVAADARSTALLPQVLTAAVLDVALGIIRDLDDVRALSRALSGDIAARANSEGRPVDLMHAHARAIALTYAHALELARSDAITRTRAAGPELVRTLDLAPASAMADAIAGDLADVIIRGRERAVDLAEAIDQDLSILGAFDFDIGHVVELARVHSAALDPAYARALGIAHSPDFGVAAALRLTGIANLDWGVALPGVLGLPLRWVADGPLGRTLLGVLPVVGVRDRFRFRERRGGAGRRSVSGVRRRARVAGRVLTTRPGCGRRLAIRSPTSCVTRRRPVLMNAPDLPAGTGRRGLPI